MKRLKPGHESADGLWFRTAEGVLLKNMRDWYTNDCYTCFIHSESGACRGPTGNGKCSQKSAANTRWKRHSKTLANGLEVDDD